MLAADAVERASQAGLEVVEVLLAPRKDLAGARLVHMQQTTIFCIATPVGGAGESRRAVD